MCMRVCKCLCMRSYVCTGGVGSGHALREPDCREGSGGICRRACRYVYVYVYVSV